MSSFDNPPARPVRPVVQKVFGPDSGAPVRLYFFHTAGSGFSEYQEAGYDTMFPDYEVCLIEFPGHSSRRFEEAHSDPHKLVDELLPQLCLPTDMPYAFFGVSFGALIAYLLTAELEKRAEVPGPKALFLCSEPSPDAMKSGTEFDLSLSDDDLLKTMLASPYFSDIPDEFKADIEIMMPFCIRTKACLLCERDFTKPTNKLKTPVRLFVGGNDTHVAKSFTEWNSVSLSAEEGGDFKGELLEGFEHLFPFSEDAAKKAVWDAKFKASLCDVLGLDNVEKMTIARTAVLRAGSAMDSDNLGELAAGTAVEVLETVKLENGKERARLGGGLAGWVSKSFLK